MALATDAAGNLYAQFDDHGHGRAAGLRWAIEDLGHVLADLEPGPLQGEWVAEVYAARLEAPKPKPKRKPKRRRHAT